MANTDDSKPASETEKRAKQFAEVLQWAQRSAEDLGWAKTVSLVEHVVTEASASMHGKDAAIAANLVAESLVAAAKRINPDR